MSPTPTPWTFDGHEINGPWDGKMVPTVVGLETHGRRYEYFETLVLSPEDAALVVRAVNSHEALVEALRDSTAILERITGDGWEQAQDQANENVVALALAEKPE